MPLHTNEKYCGSCGRKMRKEAQGLKVQHGDETNSWAYGDEWRCPDCGCSVITGFGEPIFGGKDEQPVEVDRVVYGV
jgi:predicted RNA-binding Zn-ribbon protein involved in translation (DUF1610 family)